MFLTLSIPICFSPQVIIGEQVSNDMHNTYVAVLHVNNVSFVVWKSQESNLDSFL
jgi:hypothetical protein